MIKVLVIQETFAPQNNCAAIPNTKLTKYLEHEDVSITLITSACSPDMNIDESLIPKEMDNIKTLRVPQSRLFLNTLTKTRKSLTDSGAKLKMKAETRPLRALVVSLIKNLYFWLRRKDWVHNVKKMIRTELKNEHFDVVYSSYPALQSHDVGKFAIKYRLADKWVADFRDPMCYLEYDKYKFKRAMRKQAAIERMADAVTIVSEGAMDKFLCDGVSKDKIVYLPNGFDYEDYDVSAIANKAVGDKLRIFYAGTLYAGKRDLTPLFQAISELSEEKKVDASKISIEYAGNEWPVMLSFAERFGLAEICTDYGYITRQRVMEIMGEIDCSIVCTHNTKSDKGVVTGKVFELLLVGKPIIAVVGGDEPDSELGNIVKQCNAGIVYEQANDHKDYETLKKWLKKTYDEKINKGYVQSMLIESERDKYSYGNISHELYKVIERVAN